MADSVSYADRSQRATFQSRWARAQRACCDLGTSKRRRHSTTKDREHYENLTGQAGQTTSEIGNSLVGPGRRRVGLESRRPGRSWARDLNISRAWPGAGWAERGRPGPVRPHLPELTSPAKTVGF